MVAGCIVRFLTDIDNQGVNLKCSKLVKDNL